MDILHIARCWMLLYVAGLLLMIKICRFSVYMIHNMIKLCVTWALIWLFNNVQWFCILSVSAFGKRIFCLCYIKIWCFWYSIIRWLVAPFFWRWKKCLTLWEIFHSRVSLLHTLPADDSQQIPSETIIWSTNKVQVATILTFKNLLFWARVINPILRGKGVVPCFWEKFSSQIFLHS